jgi:signal peptidase I
MIAFWFVSTTRGDKHPNTHRFHRVRREFEQAGALDFGARRPAPGFEAAARLAVQLVPLGRAANGSGFAGKRTVRRVFAATGRGLSSAGRSAGRLRPNEGVSAAPVIGPSGRRRRRPVPRHLGARRTYKEVMTLSSRAQNLLTRYPTRSNGPFATADAPEGLSMSETMQASAPPEKSGAMAEIVEIIKTIIYALLIALFLRVLFFQPYTIPSASMEPNLYEGDYIIVSKWTYGYSKHSIPLSPPLFSGRILERPAHRGDIVVFKLPHDNSTDYIKRIIGLPGDRIQMKQGLLYLNGKQVPRVSLGTVREDSGYGFMHDVTRYRETLPGGKSYVTNDFGPTGDLDNTDVYVVPEHHYFMMGDNRDNSSDSRVSPEAGGVGYVPAENLEGKAQIILLSWKAGASIFKPWTWVLNAQPSRFFHLLQ